MSIMGLCKHAGQAAILVAWTCLATAGQAQTYTFAGFTFEQQYTPDIGTVLAAGNYNGINVQLPPESGPNLLQGFPTDRTDFHDPYTLGRLVGLYSAGARGLNLPRGNNGSLVRSGIEVTWSGTRKLLNLPGDDFIVFESAGSVSEPEGFLVQVYVINDEAWSSWYYEPADSFQVYNGEASEGAHATGIDLTDMGIGSGKEIDRIRLVNLSHLDRTVAANGIGAVLPEDNGATSSYLPAPGPLAAFGLYGANTLDPDPIYIAALHEPLAAICGNSRVEPANGEQCDPGADIPNDCCTVDCLWETNGTSCDDTLYCTVSDFCTDGSCSGPDRDCDDANFCTADSCDDTADTCVNDPAPLNGTTCDDGVFCTVEDTCAAGACLGTVNPCDDTNPCTQDSCDTGIDECIHPTAPLDGSSCDDGDPCTSATTCSTGACADGEPVLVCGDSYTCGPEQCDDGNVVDLDGCSSQCDTEVIQTREQKSCLRGLNGAGHKVANAQETLGVRCLNWAKANRVVDAQACLTADDRGQVAVRKARTNAEAASPKCALAPVFGENDPEVINTATVAEPIALVADLFGPNLESSAALLSVDPPGTRCQKAVLDSSRAISSAMRQQFVRCKSAGLSNDSIRARAGLEECFNDIRGGPSGALKQARIRLGRAFGLSGKSPVCVGLDTDALFPGVCVGSSDFRLCAEARAACRACRAINEMDRTQQDCDAFDDESVNGSCP